MIAGGAPGFYGKVPIRGDFVSRRLPWTFIDPWDRWLQEGLACSREQLRDAWLQIYLTSPVWRFALTPGVCGDSGWVGVVLPSVDRVGRYFPLTVARPWTGADSALAALTGLADWLQRAERLGLSALEEGFDLDAFDRAVEDAGAPPAINGLAPPAQGGPVGTPPPFGWHFAAADSGDGAPGCRSLGETLLQALLPLHSAWSSQGSDLVAPCLAIARGLPPASGFAALLSGAWARWGWAQAAAVRTPVAAPAVESTHAIDPPPVAAPRAARWSSAACTHTGNVRTHNEDACLALPERGIWAVADGMGGHAQGDVASREVVESLRALPDEPELAELTVAAATALGRVNASLRQLATSLAAQGGVIGSTVVLLLARGGHASCVWAGDSRIYLYRDGELRALTRDHSLVEELVLRGEISPEHALAHPEANALTRAVGGEDRLEVDEVCVDARPGDLFLLCSDGLTKEMPHDEIAAALAGVTDLQGACEALVQGALAHGGRDNVTVVLARFEA